MSRDAKKVRGLKKSQESLVKWGKEDWGTKSGRTLAILVKDTCLRKHESHLLTRSTPVLLTLSGRARQKASSSLSSPKILPRKQRSTGVSYGRHA